MWSDRPPEARRRRLAERLRAVLPAPDPHARGAVTPLRVPGPKSAATVEQMAEELRTEPGFVWLGAGDGGSGHRFFTRPLALLTVRNGRATVSGSTGTGGRATFAAGGFDLLEAAFDAWGGPSRGLLVGWLGYELGAELEILEPTPANLEDDLKLPDLHLALYDAALRHDENGWRLESTDAWRGADGDRVREAEARLAAARKREVPEPPAGRLATGPVTGRPNARGFMEAVERAVSRIRRGQIYQVNLCRRLEAELPADRIWPLWQRLRAASPADYGAFLDAGTAGNRGRAVLSVSPELFLSVHDGTVETKPIKGTRPRGANPRADRALARELEESAKDRAELAMIVDVARNDLGRVCATGSIEVVRHAELVTLPTLHHTVSTVRGRLRPEDATTPVRLLRAAFPPASITGAPKIQAMIVAAGEEERRRGPAMGALGWLSLGGDLELSVAIRTAAASGGRVVYHSGCGITADSDPELELEEAAVKARAFLTALGASESP
jgi:para-aminobenzoate synthetase component 1